LEEGVNVEQLEARLLAFRDRHLYADDEDFPDAQRVEFYLQKLTDIHLHSAINNEIGQNGDIRNVYMFAVIGVVIMLLACVNYTNLAIARSIKRAREVGMRKVIGAERRQVIGQFLGESVLMACLAFVVGLGLVQLVLPTFVNLVDRPLRFGYLETGMLIPALLALVVLVGLISGSYPAIFMASLRPMDVLTGRTAGGPKRFQIQRMLIFGQYAVSIILVAGSFVIHRQLEFVHEKNVGYDREHIVVVESNVESISANFAAIRDEWLRNPQVNAVSSSKWLPTDIRSSTVIRLVGEAEGTLSIYQTDVGYDFLDVFDIELAAGRPFSSEFAADADGGNLLVNETAARALGWSPQEATGRNFIYNDRERTIVGVVEDFHMHSMHLPIAPLMLHLNPGGLQFISAKVRPEGLTATIASMRRAVEQFSPYPLDYQFLDDRFDQLYRREEVLRETFGLFTALALFIASVGLFGLAAYAAEQRTMEIGIRKALGAGVAGLVVLLSKDFLKLVSMAFIVGAPIAYFAAQRWLENFAYHINLDPGIFLLAGGAALVIALLAVTYQALRAALLNPVTCLRSE
jgi:putative ABC transport system permease protein